MSEFKVGDRIKLINIKDPEGVKYIPGGSNTVGNVGSIIRVRHNGFGGITNAYDVEWDNGTSNSYWDGNLRKILLNMKNK